MWVQSLCYSQSIQSSEGLQLNTGSIFLIMHLFVYRMNLNFPPLQYSLVFIRSFGSSKPLALPAGLVWNWIWWRDDGGSYRSREREREKGRGSDLKRDGGEYRQRVRAQQESRLWAGWCWFHTWMFAFLSSFFPPDCLSIKSISPSSSQSSLWSSFLTLRVLSDPEPPASSGCFNKFIRVKLTHWIKSDGGRELQRCGGRSVIQLFKSGFCIC